MDFGALETEIATYLNTQINDDKVKVNELPESEEEFKQPFGYNQVYVAFGNEDAEHPQILFPVEQDTTITLSILILGKKLRHASGLYQLAEQIKLLLIGYKATNCDKMTFASHKFVSNEKDVFKYILDFKIPSKRVENYIEPTGPPFTGATFIEQT